MHVEAVSSSPDHGVGKRNGDLVRLLAGVGVEGDVHAGATVRHRSRLRREAEQPNLRQVHLIHGELLDELEAAGFAVAPGVMGENITTRGIDLLGLPQGAKLQLGEDAIVEVTGLRNPCRQLDGIQKGLMQAVLDRDADGGVIRKAGVMAIVLERGDVRPGDPIALALPGGAHVPLAPV